jgi:TolB protein
VTAALLVPPSPAHATFPGTNGRIAFASDTDGDYDIYTVNPDGSDLTQLTNDPANDRDPAWSADGRLIAFTRDGALYVMEHTGASQTLIRPNGTVGLAAIDPSWSPNGNSIAWWGRDCCEYAVLAVSANGHVRSLIRTPASISMFDTDWSVDDNVMFSRSEHANSADLYVIGQFDPTQVTDLPGDELDGSWSPDGESVAFSRSAAPGAVGIWRMCLCTGSAVQVTADVGDRHPAWSPDGSRFVLSKGVGDIVVVDSDGANPTPIASSPAHEVEPDWQPAPVVDPPRYVRPVAASPLRAALVVAYQPCDEPNSEHGPPLAFTSCSPPVQASNYLTVGTGGVPPKFVGWTRLKAVVGDPGTTADEADLAVRANLTDVRCRPAQIYPCSGVALADYTGDLQLAMAVRITDGWTNAFGQAEQLTMTDIYRFPITVPCTGTPDTTVGATCAVSTTLDALSPGTIKEGARTMWQLGHIEVRDGGEDGSASSDDYTIFATQGLFVP